MVVLLGPTHMEQAAERSVQLDQELSAMACALDPVIQAIGLTLRREFYSGWAADRQYLEAIGTLLSGHLNRQWTTGSVPATSRGRLSSGQLQKTIDLIEAAPPLGLSIAGLARQLDMGNIDLPDFSAGQPGQRHISFC